MEELRSWWEVPAISHFFTVFTGSLNLFNVDVEELEAALLQQNRDDSVSVEQIIIRLLPQCCGVKDVTINTWEKYLAKLLEEKWPKEGRQNPLRGGMKFYTLPVRTKVEIIYSLCNYRLDADDVFDAMRNIASCVLRPDCLGPDSEQAYYWYFGGVRLYKEVQSKKESPKNDKSGRSTTSKKPLPSRMANWSVVCFSIEDWKDLAKSLKKQRKVANQKIAKDIEEKFMPLLAAITARKERELKKRLMELAPRRCSSRIDQVRKQKEMAERRAAALAEEERIRKAVEEEKRRAVEAKERKKKEVVERAKRLEDRRKALEARATRARYRDLLKVEDESEDNDENSIHSGKVSIGSLADILIEKSDLSDDYSDEESQSGDESVIELTDSENETEQRTEEDDGSIFYTGPLPNIGGDIYSSASEFKDTNKRSRVDISVHNSSSSSDEYIPILCHKKVKLVKSKDYKGEPNSPSITWNSMKSETVPCKEIIVCKEREKSQNNTISPALRRQLARQCLILRKKNKVEERNKTLGVAEHDENDDNSESGSSCYSVELKDNGDAFFRAIACESDRKERKPLFSNNLQYFGNFSEFKTTGLHSSVQHVSPQQSSSQRTLFTRRKITIVNPKSKNEPQGEDKSSSWSVKSTSVPSEKVSFTDKGNLPNCEEKIRFYTKPNARVAVSRIDLVNVSPKKVQKISSRVHR